MTLKGQKLMRYSTPVSTQFRMFNQGNEGDKFSNPSLHDLFDGAEQFKNENELKSILEMEDEDGDDPSDDEEFEKILKTNTLLNELAEV